MEETVRRYMNNIRSADKTLQNEAYFQLLKLTDERVDWAYDIWDELLDGLSHKDNHVRAISAQVLCNLAKSDPKERILRDFETLLAVTKDERFVTARHCLQSLWKVGVAGKKQHSIYMEGLERRFHECIVEKNCTLVRYDILQSFRNVYDVLKEETIWQKALELIDSEADPKYRKKYAGLWRK